MLLCTFKSWNAIVYRHFLYFFQSEIDIEGFLASPLSNAHQKDIDIDGEYKIVDWF